MNAEYKRPKVLIVAGQLSLGGAERELVTFLEGGAPQYLDVQVVSLAQGGEFRPRIEELLRREVRSPPRADRVSRVLWMKGVINRISPDLIHAWNLFPIFYLWLTGARRRCPVIGFLQQTPDQAMAESTRPWLYRFLVEQTDALVSNSRIALDDTARLGVRRTQSVVIHNAVSQQFFGTQPSERALKEKGNGVVLVALGRLIERKRNDWMIRALPQLPGVALWLIGDGPTRAALQALAKELGVEDQVLFWGSLEEPAPVLAAADVFVHCAWAEGLPNAVQEAMAVGLPIIAPRVSGIPEIIHNGSEGLLFERRDFEGFVNMLGRLATDANLRATIARQAKEKAEKGFIPSAMTKKMLAFYDEVLYMSGGRGGKLASAERLSNSGGQETHGTR